MAISPVTICNMALSHIGSRSKIEALTELSAEANECNLWYDFSRKQSLAGLDWKFARKRQALALHSEAADMIDWTYRYKVPSDCIVMRRLINPLGRTNDAIPFEIEMDSTGAEETILTNLESAVGRYTFNQTNADLFSHMFVEAFSYNLAHHICYKLTNKLDLRDKLLQTFLITLRTAAAINANEAVTEAPREAEWIRGR